MRPSLNRLDLLSDYRRARRAVAGLALAAAVAATGSLTTLAAGDFADGTPVGGDTADTYSYAAGPYALPYESEGERYVWTFATGEDGNAYYSAYADGAWGDWQAMGDQPTAFKGQPTAVDYADSRHVFYAGEDGKVYANRHDGEAWAGWRDQSGDYRFPEAPYADVYGDQVHLYGTADDGTLYHKAYDSTEWTAWAAVSDDATAAAYQPHAVAWGGYENVFWTGEDGKVYWNRYDGEVWTGAKALPGDGYEYAQSPYAVGYSEGEQLHAYAVTADGVPTYNAFDGEGWSGWDTAPSEAPAPLANQPSVYEHEGALHAVYTSEDGHAYYASYDGTWSEEWVDLGENYAYEPYAYADGDGYTLLYTGTDGYVYAKKYAADAAPDDDYAATKAPANTPTPEYTPAPEYTPTPDSDY
ncbi:MAG: hypothetical protein AVDCRST_MAG49-4638 [uncultured Thermomicrobiales bacterium]|uniref:Uncharacterized protein n=1 Tax=uncultured Thermomicrobiales bacterium TaxID=1645740 RepID=A0A6J4VJ32_9BACT|nr:MAG: hypothetical protein AVDCRST_MAG49-4638 [uncultured Thermomicrobiales bacterium]